MQVTFRSFQRSEIVFGPRPGISSIGIRPAGTLAATSSKSLLEPVLMNCSMIRWLEGPMPSRSFSAPLRQASSRSMVMSLRIRETFGEGDGFEGVFTLDVHEGGEGAEKIGKVCI